MFPEKELGVIIENNIQQFMVNSSKVDFLAHRALMKAVYGEVHPCGRLVQKEDYGRINPAVLKEFYDRHYHSRNCTIYVSGKVGDDCVRRIEDMFGKEAFGKDFRKPERREFIPVSSMDKRIFVEHADAMQSAVRMGMLSLERHHPDYLKTRVMVTLFGGYFGSRLMSNIREEKGYTYAQMSVLSGVPLGTIQKIFSGETESPRYDTLQALEQLFSEKSTVCEEASYQADRNGSYTLDDYYALPDEQRVELIDGYFYDMSAPTFHHQSIGGEIHRQIANYILEHKGSCTQRAEPSSS